MAQLILMPGKERSAFKQRHPWLFAGSVGRLDGRARPGDTVEVLADNLRPLGRAAYSPKSQIRARVWSFDPDETIDDAFFKRRVAAAVARRPALPELRGQQGLRLIHAESDGLPGVIADRYGDTVVVQLTSAGADKWRDAIVDGLLQGDRLRAHLRALRFRRARPRRPGADDRLAAWRGAGGAADASRRTACGWRSISSAATRPASTSTSATTARLLGQLAAGKARAQLLLLHRRLFAAGAGRRRGERALDRHLRPGAGAGAGAIWRSIRNSTAERAEWREANVFEELRDFRKDGRLNFDLIVLDPPKFAPSAAHAERAARAYKDINLLGFQLLKPGGLLMTYSCSGGIGLELFQKIVAGAALDAGREARIVQRLQGAADHPVALTFPEGEYLKGLLVQVD